MSDAAGAYNAVTYLLDRNIEAGRTAKLAFTDGVRELSYGALRDESNRAANLLKSLGVRREERVAMIMLDTVDFPIVFLGAIRAGIVPVPLNTLLTAEQYAYVLADCRARVLVVSEALLPVVRELVGRMPDLEHVIVAGGNAHGFRKLSDDLAAQPTEFKTAATHPDEPAFWLYSSGSTGMPKGVRHLHASLAATAETYAAQVLGIREDDVGLSAAKLFFAYGLGNALTFPMSVGATTILNPERPTPAVMFALLQRYNPTIFFGVPTLFAAMLNDETLKEATAGTRLRVCTSAGEALPESVGHAWAKRFGADILDGVGSTELLHIFLSNTPGDIRYGSSGRPVPGYRVRLVDDAGIDVADGEIGEMLVDAPSAGEGYWNQRSKSRRTFEGHWTRTGDKYIREADGRYIFCGRADDMFKVSGIWVSPFEVESALITHPAVLEAAVVPEPDGEGLLKPKAFIVLRADAARADLPEALKEHVKQKIGPWKYPRWIEMVESLPKTATGKIQRFQVARGRVSVRAMRKLRAKSALSPLRGRGGEGVLQGQSQRSYPLLTLPLKGEGIAPCPLRVSPMILGASGFLHIGDADLEYTFIGPQPDIAPTLVLLHEGLGAAALWFDLPSKLAQATGCGVLAYSRAGYGQSSAAKLPREPDYMHREALDVLPSILDAIGLRRGVLIGHSDGASIATIYSGSVQDHRLRGLALLAPHFIVEDVSIVSISAIRTAYETTDLKVKLGRWHRDADNAFRGWNDAWLDPRFRDWDISEQLGYIRVPVAIIQGADDQYGTLRQIEVAREECYCPVDVTIIPGVAHSPHREAAAQTLDVLTDFVNRILKVHEA